MDRDQFARIAKALADPRRFEILERIAAQDELPCKHLVDTFPISQATISHHLKELTVAGLIEVRREAQCCHYRPRSGVIAEYLEETARRLGAMEEAR
jgi:ArsR family transcriptional regulator